MSARIQSFEISWLWLNCRYKQRIFDCFSWCSALYFPSTFVNLWKLQFVSWYFVIEKISVWNYHYNCCSSETYLAINSLNVLFECFVLFWFFFHSISLIYHYFHFFVRYGPEHRIRYQMSYIQEVKRFLFQETFNQHFYNILKLSWKLLQNMLVNGGKNNKNQRAPDILSQITSRLF